MQPCILDDLTDYTGRKFLFLVELLKSVRLYAREQLNNIEQLFLLFFGIVLHFVVVVFVETNYVNSAIWYGVSVNFLHVFVYIGTLST